MKRLQNELKLWCEYIAYLFNDDFTYGLLVGMGIGICAALIAAAIGR